MVITTALSRKKCNLIYKNNLKLKQVVQFISLSSGGSERVSFCRKKNKKCTKNAFFFGCVVCIKEVCLKKKLSFNNLHSFQLCTNHYIKETWLLK